MTNSAAMLEHFMFEMGDRQKSHVITLIEDKLKH